MLQHEAVEALRACVVAITGMQDDRVYLSFGDMGRPAHEHIEIRVRNDVGVGKTGRVDADTTRQQRVMTVDLNAYGESVVGDGACSRLRRVSRLLMSDIDPVRTMYAAGVHPQRVDAWTDLTEVLHSSEEPRAIVTAELGYQSEDSWAEPAAVTSIAVDLDAVDDGDTTVADQDAVITVIP